MGIALVFAGGERSPPSVLDGLLPPDLVIAADSGLEHALALVSQIDLVVGDLDSATLADLERAAAMGAAIERHPVAKDATDLELAIGAARARGIERVVVIGGYGGRLDHFLANALVLTAPAFAGMRVEARIGEADLTVVHDSAMLHGHVGELCSLLPVGGPARAVRTEGLRFPLVDEDLHTGSTRGVSNEFLAQVARVSLSDGVLLAIVPQARKAGT